MEGSPSLIINDSIPTRTAPALRLLDASSCPRCHRARVTVTESMSHRVVHPQRRTHRAALSCCLRLLLPYGRKKQTSSHRYPRVTPTVLPSLSVIYRPYRG